MLVAHRNLTRERTRLALSVLGVALAIMLVLLLDGFLAGMYRQITTYLEHSDSQLVVVQEGVENLLGATSRLPPGTVSKVEQVEGVAEAVPILSQFVILDLHGKKQAAYLVGYTPERGGGPWRIVEGRQPQADDEMVFDRVLARRHEIELGDRVEVMGQEFAVVGLSDDTASWMTSFFFLPASAAEGLLRTPQAASFVFVTLEPGASAEAVRREISELPGTQALSKSEMEANDIDLYAEFFSAPVRLMSGIAFLIGALVVGLVIYTATVERRREYGVLKAIGAPNRVLYTVVLVQAGWAALGGTLLGIALAQIARGIIMSARPQFLIDYPADMVGRALAVGVGMALLAALFPARAVARLAPAEVFRR